MFGTEYRPLNFDDVLGLDNIKDILRAILKSKDYDPAYLFVGEYSSGKTTLGRMLARSILCSNRKEDMSPCNECPSCKDFLEERSLAYIEVDAANNSTKEKIQEILEALIYETVAEKRIILLDECHEISKAGKDALLIQLEKKNKNVVFIFCTTAVDKMPPELRSRCVEFQLPLPTEANIQKKLEHICKVNNFNYTPDALSTIIQATGRHYRDAEIRLGTISKLGDINEENVGKVVTLYNKELAYLLSTLTYDLTKAFKAVEWLTGRVNIKNIYESILRMLNDSIKYTQGFTFESTSYNEILKILSKQYGTSAFEVVDYLLTKNRLNDLTMFQSDLLIIHYKFLQGHFEPKEPTPRKPAPESTTKVEKSPQVFDFDFINKQPPWEKEELIRQVKHKKLQEHEESKVPENVSKEWGPQIIKTTAAKKAVLRQSITHDALKAVKGSQNGFQT
jgi:DNA polymerase-3 subunit gamma/tau